MSLTGLHSLRSGAGRQTGRGARLAKKVQSKGLFRGWVRKTEVLQDGHQGWHKVGTVTRARAQVDQVSRTRASYGWIPTE